MQFGSNQTREKRGGRHQLSSTLATAKSRPKAIPSKTLHGKESQCTAAKEYANLRLDEAVHCDQLAAAAERVAGEAADS
jgi:hypothetical protein